MEQSSQGAADGHGGSGRVSDQLLVVVAVRWISVKV